MENIFIKISALIFAFLLGVSVSDFYFLHSIPKISEPALIKPKETFECFKVKSFPGLSQKISDIEEFKDGYFPKNNFTGGWEHLDAFFNDWYSEHLKAMSERSLVKDSAQNPEIYRFLWLRSFQHPVFVRIERTSTHSFDLISIELSGAGDYESDRVLRTARHSLTEAEWCKFIQLLDESNYWKMPTTFIDKRGSNGSQWILEGVKDGRYHLVSRRPLDSGAYREAGIYLLKLSGIDVDRLKDDLY